MLRPQERTPPRPRPVRDGVPLTEAELGQALRELRDTWAGLTQVTLAKRAGLSDSAVSARERGYGVPSTKVLDKFVITCLNHRGLTPQQIVSELTYWHDARKALDLRRREQAPPVPSAQPDPAPPSAPPTPPVAADPVPVPATLDDTAEQGVPLEAISGAGSPEPAPDVAPDQVSEGASRRRADWTPKRQIMGVAAVATVVAAVGGVIGLSGLYGPHTAAETDRQPSPRAAPPPVDSPPYVPGTTYSETVNSQAGARTFTNPSGMVGEGDRIPNDTTVHVSCMIVAPGGSSVGTYWYRITDPPWQDYYSPTNSFLNDDPTHGSHKKGVDEKVPYCPT
ncbi:MAG: helix-turn-helix domain-containing protein [Pseudonocardiaceae bacterium]